MLTRDNVYSVACYEITDGLEPRKAATHHGGCAVHANVTKFVSLNTALIQRGNGCYSLEFWPRSELRLMRRSRGGSSKPVKVELCELAKWILHHNNKIIWQIG